MSKLYLFNYNNYFNRIIKRGVAITDYGTPVYTLSETNFDENDGVTATHTINYNGFDGDYLVITDKDDKIQTRWFVVESRKQRGGQHTLQLRRDLIADYYNQIINAPALINRAMIQNENSPLLFNSEGFSFNQIKKNEILLKDKSLNAWYILYFPLNTPTLTGSFEPVEYPADTISNVSINAENSIWKSGTYSVITDRKYFVNYDPKPITYPVLAYACKVQEHQIPSNIVSTVQKDGLSEDFIWFDDDNVTVENKLASIFDYNEYEAMNTIADTQYITNTIKANSWYEEVSKFNELVVKTIVNNVINYYKVKVTIEEHIRTGYVEEDTALFNEMKNAIDDAGMEYTGDIDDYAFQYYYKEYIVKISNSPVTTGTTVTWSISFGGKATPVDAPYHIIAIPYNDFNLDTFDHDYSQMPPVLVNNAYLSKKETNAMFVNSIINVATSTNLLDVQILPYFPYIASLPSSAFSINESELMNIMPDTTNNYLEENVQYQGYNPNSHSACCMFYIDKASFTFDISQSISIPARTDNPALNKKLSNELDTYRLCSPNYNGLFEFSVAKNNGVSKFNVDVTLRPYNPYIHINPDFKGIYGADFNDIRGLICQGDFSLPIITDLWKQYEYQNKNYQQIFNRQIEHMDFEFSKARTEALFGATVGSIGAGVSGGVTGAMVSGGNPIGAGIGAGIGTIASAIGGAIDYSILKERQAEAKDLAMDNFSYQLGNIKALPYSVNKVTCLTFNNKLWPFIEVYSATEEEANILNNKILYNSMRVNAIGLLGEYIVSDRTFISASLIRLEELEAPTHEANEIYDEIMKGVYI